MGNANEVLQQFSNGTLSRLDDTEFYYDPNNLLEKGGLSNTISRYNKNQVYAPYEFKDTIDAYQKALEETKNDFQHIPLPLTSQQRRPENKRTNSKKTQTRFLIQNNNNNNNNSIRHPSSSSFTSTVHNIKPSRESIKKDIEQFQPPSTWSTLPKHELFIKYPTVITMEELMNQLKHEVERYTYLLDDTEKVMKDYENDIDETLNNLQDLENKIKEMNTKTVAYAEQQLNMRLQLNITMNNNKNDKNARRIQHKLNEKIDKWKSRKDPLVQLSNILTTHEQLITLNKLTDRFWNIIYYIILGISIIIIMLLLWLPHLTP
ncbi:unnamed protein product [Cunninghamella echinulata]